MRKMREKIKSNKRLKLIERRARLDKANAHQREALQVKIVKKDE